MDNLRFNPLRTRRYKNELKNCCKSKLNRPESKARKIVKKAHRIRQYSRKK